MDFSRRGFLKGLSAALGGAVASQFLPSAPLAALDDLVYVAAPPAGVHLFGIHEMTRYVTQRFAEKADWEKHLPDFDLPDTRGPHSGYRLGDDVMVLRRPRRFEQQLNVAIDFPDGMPVDLRHLDYMTDLLVERARQLKLSTFGRLAIPHGSDVEGSVVLIPGAGVAVRGLQAWQNFSPLEEYPGAEPWLPHFVTRFDIIGATA